MSRAESRSPIKLNYEFLPPSIADLNIAIPTGRPAEAALLAEQVLRQSDVEGLQSPDMYFALYGINSDESVLRNFTLLPDTDTRANPMFMMTSQTKVAVYRAIRERLPPQIQNDPSAVEVVKYFCTGGHYAPQREQLGLPFSTRSQKLPDFEERDGHLSRIVGQLDDDLVLSAVPYLREEKARELLLSTGTNSAALLHEIHLTNGCVEWETDQLLSPYTLILGRKLGEAGIRTYQRGQNTQNIALEATNGGATPQSFVEHFDATSVQIDDPNAVFILAFGKKFRKPDFEASSNLCTFARTGIELADLPIVAIPTGRSETIGLQTHDVNMDTAHQFRDWSNPLSDILFYVMSHPEISDKYRTMSNLVGGVSRTGGVRAEMCSLIGPDGLLKQISDAFHDSGPYLAAQVSSTFDHRRLGGTNGLRAPECVAAFSEMLGMQLAEIIRGNLIINTSNASMSLNRIPPSTEMVSQETVEAMFERMLEITREIDSTIIRLRQGGQDSIINQMLATKLDINQRLRTQDGLPAFYMAIQGELREQYNFMSQVLDIRTCVQRAGADLRREGKFPIARVHNTQKAQQQIF